MNNEQPIDEFVISKDKKSIYWKHFFIFYVINFLLIILLNYIGKNVNQGEHNMFLLNLVTILSTPILYTLMIFTHKSEKSLKFVYKIYGLIGFVGTQFIFSIIFALINPFNRNITQEALFQGMIRGGIFTIIMFVFCLIPAALTKSRIIKH